MKRLIALILSALYLTACAGSVLPPEFQDVPSLPLESVLFLDLQHGRCTAVAIGPGLALTAGHCVSPEAMPGVALSYDGSDWAVPTYRESSTHDIAVISLYGGKTLAGVPVAQDLPAKGDPVYIVGYGCPSFDPNLALVRLGVWTGVTQQDGDWPVIGTVCPGDSGGALFNSDGELLGILARKSPGVAYVVPAAHAADLFD